MLSPGNNIFQIKHKRSLIFNTPTLYSIDGIIFIENEIKASYQRFPLLFLNINSQHFY
ncbi:hypothetical protein EC2864350_1542 [Escherichia coli 2864350]|nr:hypothetical protein EC2780750_2046 [Escherichia coli 2780750]EMX51172.1 hypothetical protein ECMP0209802_2077 [Escherichia coli MP020980.2]ENA96706.1 hypothetical protein EC2864350_1542 [Escherichia coli 2864350]END53766.1 hypothetical protein ECMP0209801_1760 [Escherichia coli MP020980.1]ESA66798.1 hypothetical protein HMPREF1591_01457 [Escherichia coli 113303]EZJ14463.1 hypothetical protein AD39_4823 [Escherichia coli 1-182-04_S4_C3]EZJ43711.1 hypothetical protein AD10_1734 [Escherichia